MVFEGFGAAVNGVMLTSLNLEGSGGASLRMSRIPVELIYRVSFRNKDLWLGGAIILEQTLSAGGLMDRAERDGLRKGEDKIHLSLSGAHLSLLYYNRITITLAPSRAMTS